jgi:hypothetical protein
MAGQDNRGTPDSRTPGDERGSTRLVHVDQIVWPSGPCRRGSVRKQRERKRTSSNATARTPGKVIVTKVLDLMAVTRNPVVDLSHEPTHATRPRARHSVRNEDACAPIR